MRQRSNGATAILSLCGLVVLSAVSGDLSPVQHPGALGGGVTLLPNGWKIPPAGPTVGAGRRRPAWTAVAEGMFLFSASKGSQKPAAPVVEGATQRVVAPLVLDPGGRGLAWHPDGNRLYVSGAGNSTVHELRWE